MDASEWPKDWAERRIQRLIFETRQEIEVCLRINDVPGVERRRDRIVALERALHEQPAHHEGRNHV